MKRNRGRMRGARCSAAAVALAGACGAWAQGAAPPGAASAAPSERFGVCLGCHGSNGTSAMAETPSLAGQHSFYAITQLFLFRQGRRANPAMTAVAGDLTDADLRAFSDLIAKLPPAPPVAPTPAEPERMARGAELAKTHQCAACHGDDYAGEKQTPRIAAQREDYLAKTLAEFKAAKRVGYTSAMNEVLAGVAADELPDLAHYLAHLPPRP